MKSFTLFKTGDSESLQREVNTARRTMKFEKEPKPRISLKIKVQGRRREEEEEEERIFKTSKLFKAFNSKKNRSFNAFDEEPKNGKILTLSII
jgi:hypothetical protein